VAIANVLSVSIQLKAEERNQGSTSGGQCVSMVLEMTAEQFGWSRTFAQIFFEFCVC